MTAPEGLINRGSGRGSDDKDGTDNRDKERMIADEFFYPFLIRLLSLLSESDRRAQVQADARLTGPESAAHR
jgi:hypothetical protein